MLSAWDISKVDTVMWLGNPDENDRVAWGRIKNELKELAQQSHNSAMAKLLNELDRLVWNNIHGLGAVSELGDICERWRNIRQ